MVEAFKCDVCSEFTEKSFNQFENNLTELIGFNFRLRIGKTLSEDDYMNDYNGTSSKIDICEECSNRVLKLLKETDFSIRKITTDDEYDQRFEDSNFMRAWDADKAIDY